MNLKDILIQLGFNQNKANVYLACLELGSASASQIAKEANTVRTTVYKILDELQKNNLIEVGLKNNTKIFVAKNPDSLIRLLEDNKKRAENALPDFLNIFKSTKFKPKIKFYEGSPGLKKVFEAALASQEKTIYTFSPAKNIIEQFGRTYTRHLMEKRIVAKTFRRSLRQHGDVKQNKKDWEIYISNPKKFLREIKFLPPNIKFDTLIQIYDNKISVVSSEKEGFAFIMESQELSSFMKQIFNFLWSISQI